jgi:hypothetical protein
MSPECESTFLSLEGESKVVELRKCSKWLRKNGRNWQINYRRTQQNRRIYFTEVQKEKCFDPSLDHHQAMSDLH